MSGWSIIIIAVSLALDAAIISISNALAYYHHRRQMVFAALVFGFFQALMTVLGFVAGQRFAHLIGWFDHWLAFALLALVGGKMIFDGLRQLRAKKELPKEQKLGLKLLLAQAVATSIDALVIGISFAALQVAIIPASLIIGAITTVLCWLAATIGRYLGRPLRKYAVIIGGVVLLIMAGKIFFSHL